MATRDSRAAPGASDPDPAMHANRDGAGRRPYMPESAYWDACRAVKTRVAEVGKAFGLESMSSDVQKIEAAHAWTAKTLVWDDSADKGP